MTVGSETRKIGPQAGNSTARVFSFSPMVIHDDDELVVVTTVTATGVETVRTLGTSATNYSSSIVTFPATGSISFPAAGGTLLPSTETITITRKLKLENLTKLRSQGGYDAAVQELEFDKTVQRTLQIQEQLDRSFKLPRSIPNTFDPELPKPTASYFFRANATNTGFEWIQLVDTTNIALSSATPIQTTLNTGAAGTSSDISRADHQHQSPDTVITASGMYNATNFI